MRATVNHNNIIQNVIISAKFRKVRVSKSLSCHYMRSVLQLFSDMDKALIMFQGYESSRSSRYYDKEYFESESKLRREKNARGPLKNSKQVIIKIKTHIWKAVVVNINHNASA